MPILPNWFVIYSNHHIYTKPMPFSPCWNKDPPWKHSYNLFSYLPLNCTVFWSFAIFWHSSDSSQTSQKTKHIQVTLVNWERECVRQWEWEWDWERFFLSLNWYAFKLFKSGYESSTCLRKWKINNQQVHIQPCRNFFLLSPPQLIKTHSFSIKLQPKLLFYFFCNGGPEKAVQYTLRAWKIFQRAWSCCQSCTDGMCSLPESARQFDFQNQRSGPIQGWQFSCHCCR